MKKLSLPFEGSVTFEVPDDIAYEWNSGDHARMQAVLVDVERHARNIIRCIAPIDLYMFV